MQYSIIAAIGLVLIIEGVMPFLMPQVWRRFVNILSRQTDRSLRLSGLICMIVGVSVLVIAHICC